MFHRVGKVESDGAMGGGVAKAGVQHSIGACTLFCGVFLFATCATQPTTLFEGSCFDSDDRLRVVA
jgi:hypothetical protein